ncbi:MAG TPA: transcription-repair coupling factor [Phycisphaerae bacterium]|nr:transcription-repair coupling factor [Phycisphaerae bacterium]
MAEFSASNDPRTQAGGELQSFLSPLAESAVTAELIRRLREGRHVAATGQWGSCALALAAIAQKRMNRPVLILTAHLDEADDAIDQLSFFRRGDGSAPGAGAVDVRMYPAFEVLPGESNISHELAVQRLELLTDLAAGDPQRARPDFVVAPVQAVMQPSPGRELLKELVKSVRVGDTLDRDALVRWLADHGYTRLDAVEDAGDFAVRGEIVDVWPPGLGEPVRVDFFGDQVESVHQFDLETLGPTAQLKEARLAALGDRTNWPVDKTTSLLSYLPPDTVVWLIEPAEIQEQAKSYIDRLEDARGIYPPSAVLKSVQNFAWAEIHQFGAEDEQTLRLPCRSVQRFDTKAEEAIRELAELTDRARVVVVCDSKSECTRLSDLLDVKHPGVRAKVEMPIGVLGLGFEWNEEDWGATRAGETHESEPRAQELRPLVLIGHHEIFHRYNQRRRLRGIQGARPIDSFLDLQTGDYVVHVHHGIAKFEGMTSITRDGRQSEFLTLKFAGEATLHVPVTQIHLVQKYVGGAHGRPPLSVLGGTRWSKQKEEVAEAVEKMAAELLEVQAAREHTPGIPYPADTVWQKEFENAFPYPPTEDQARSADEIKTDMGRPRPMDRLLCGDVGYGKTEVAMRAAFKVVEFGKQVAVLVPTTVLAEQHEETMRERMAGYPFLIESVSRFKTPSQVKKILERTRMGQVDILIGTHRLLSRDVQFADLGLVIIDEEQRFGVEHKERLKKLRLTVDILTMTATPIPRTLHMSLLGIRDISNLATPPSDRRSVVTEVITHDKQRIKQALQRELARNGQVFFVHNKVWNIQTVADEVRQLAPDARIVIGHGQMNEHELEEVMHKFMRHEADVLVSTTIIESGIDIPNANTMFINEAENFGLSDLHQLRGRVGRYKHRAYCYLMLSPNKALSEQSAKRLKAMEEYSSLGAGFKIALRDLEIRGAGNILGAEQSGHISAVGYEMYCQLLEESVKKIKNEPVDKPIEVNVDIGVSGVFPKTYVDSERQRMDLYRRLSRAQSLEMLEALAKDVTDAFGPMPKPVILLFGLAEIKILARPWSIVSIITKAPDVVFTITDLSKLGPLLGKGVGGAGSVRVIDEKTVHLRLPANYLEPETLVNVLRHLLNPNAPQPEQPKPEPARPVAPQRPAPAGGIRRRL